MRKENKTQIRLTFSTCPLKSISPALRSGTGASVVNGRWAVDPPGEYKAGGTTFTYIRPRVQSEGKEGRGESLRAPGPTTTQLQLYVSPAAKEGLPFNPMSKHNPGHGQLM